MSTDAWIAASIVGVALTFTVQQWFYWKIRARTWEARYRRALSRRHATGGHIPPRRTDPDSVMVQLSPGYISHDGGRTWHERPHP
ncbi:hypothetical protein [Nocardia carnea]|uniref:hypothetical protein n=1 Tax=Nocardia carnea TaxID=37328 RepID=UPI002455F8FC|nr:hypothetical protein [Nocardia carnea]